MAHSPFQIYSPVNVTLNSLPMSNKFSWEFSAGWIWLWDHAMLIYSSIKVVCQYAAPGLHAKIFFHPLFSISEVLKGSDGAIMWKIAKNHTHQQQSDNKHPIDLVITCNQISVSTCCIFPD